MADQPPSTADQINAQLRSALATADSLNVDHIDLHDYLALALPSNKRLTFKCSDSEGRRSRTGDFFGAFNNGAKLVVEGGVSRFAFDSMTAGEVIVNGNAGRGLAHNLRGGTIVVRGDVAEGAAPLMAGGILLIDGDVGAGACAGMAGGKVIITGEAGPRLGHGMLGGTIYLAGAVPRLDPTLQVARPTPAQRRELAELLHNYAIETQGLSFTQLTPGTAPPAPAIEPDTSEEAAVAEAEPEEAEILEALPEAPLTVAAEGGAELGAEDQPPSTRRASTNEAPPVDEEGPMIAELEAPPTDPMAAAVSAALHEVPPPKAEAKKTAAAKAAKEGEA